MTFRSGVSVALAGCLGAMLAAQGKSPFSEFRNERAGVVHKITLADLPAPFATRAVQNPSTLIPRPQGAMPQTLPGYSVRIYADGLQNPRLIRTAPNGDLFVAESTPGRVKVLRGVDGGGRAQTVEVFAAGLKRPFGIAFYKISSPGSSTRTVKSGDGRSG